jgi:hypothetical protein
MVLELLPALLLICLERQHGTVESLRSFRYNSGSPISLLCDFEAIM